MGAFQASVLDAFNKPSEQQNFFLRGGILRMEATGISLNHTTGAEGMTTPLTNEYQTSTGPPAGGHLSSFKREWLEENCSNNLLNIITHGYILPSLEQFLPGSL